MMIAVFSHPAASSHKLGKTALILHPMLVLLRHIGKALAASIEMLRIIAGRVPHRLTSSKATHIKATHIEESTLLKNLITASPDIIFFKNTDGQYLGGNKPHAELVGVPEDEIIGKSDFDLHPDDEHLHYIAETDQSVINTGETYQNTGQPIEFRGEIRYFDIVKTPIRSDSDEIIGLVGVARDITRVYEAEQRVKRKNKYLNELARMSVSYASNTDVYRQFETVIECAANIVGASGGSIYFADSPYDDLDQVSTTNTMPLSPNSYAKSMATRVWQQKSTIVENTCNRNIHNNRGTNTQLYDIAVPLYSQDSICGVVAFEGIETNPDQDEELLGEINSISTQLSMVVEQQYLIKTIEYQSNYDALTDIPNRKKFEESLDLTLSEANKFNTSFVLINMDLDGFKEVNDTQGHHKGDELLRQVALRLKSSIQTDEVIARLGGDEFVLIGRGVDSHAQANQTANRILNAFLSPFQLDENIIVHIGVSIGYAIFPFDASDASELMIAADSNMYLAKQGGKNQVGYQSA